MFYFCTPLGFQSPEIGTKRATALHCKAKEKRLLESPRSFYFGRDPPSFPRATLKEISNSFWCTTKMLHNKTLSLPLQPRHWSWWTPSSFHLPQSTERSIHGPSMGITGTAPASAASRAVLGSWQCEHHRDLQGEPKSLCACPQQRKL